MDEDQYGVALETLRYYLAQGDTGYDAMVARYRANPQAHEFDGFADQLNAALKRPTVAYNILSALGIQEIEGEALTKALARKHISLILDDLTPTDDVRHVELDVKVDDSGQTYDYLKGMDTKDTATKLREIWIGTRWRGIPIVVIATISVALIFAGWGFTYADIPYISKWGVLITLAGLVGVGSSAVLADIERRDINDEAAAANPAPGDSDGSGGWLSRLTGK